MFLSPAELRAAAEKVARDAEKQYTRAILIGGFAMQHYGSDRLTGDIDFASNAYLEGYTGKALSFGGVQSTSLGVPLDLVVRKDRFRSLYEAALRESFGLLGFVPVVASEYLVAMKLAAGRPKDESDLAFLITEADVDLARAKEITRVHLGPYAEQDLEQTIELETWRASRR